MKGINVISEDLNTAIIKVSIATSIAGSAAISVGTLAANPVNIEYAIAQPIIRIANCLRLNPNTIGSSFSICTGILYCINITSPPVPLLKERGVTRKNKSV
jgi:hypothetical protein